MPEPGLRQRLVRRLEKRRVYVTWGRGAGGSSRVTRPGNPRTEMGRGNSGCQQCL